MAGSDGADEVDLRPPQWTYAVVRREGNQWVQLGIVSRTKLPDPLEHMLIMMGRNGWELAAVDDGNYIFKLQRRVRDNAYDDDPSFGE